MTNDKRVPQWQGSGATQKTGEASSDGERHMEPAIPQGAAVLGEAEKRRLALLRLAEVCAACQLEVVPAVPASGTGIVKLHSVASTQGKKSTRAG